MRLVSPLPSIWLLCVAYSLSEQQTASSWVGAVGHVLYNAERRCEMNMPGFTADASLYARSKWSKPTLGWDSRRQSQIMPAQHSLGRLGDLGEGPEPKGCTPCRPDSASSLGGTQYCVLPGFEGVRECQWPPPRPDDGGGGGGGQDSCAVDIEGPVVVNNPDGPNSIYATVRTAGAGCSPQKIRLRQNRKWWPDRNLNTAYGSGENTLTVSYLCQGTGHMRVFAEAFVRGDKYRSSPRGGISAFYCS